MKKELINARLLPSVFQRAVRDGNPLSAILDVMETMHTPSESILNHLDVYFSAYRAPDRFVAYLASWVDLEVVLDSSPASASPTMPSLSTGLGRLRELTAAATSLSQWRGTAKGLRLFLETATGAQGFEVEEQVIGTDGKIRPFHLQIKAPSEVAPHRALVERIIDLEKPAYVTYDLQFSA